MWSETLSEMRDSVGYYIKGREPNTRMITGEAYAPYFSTTTWTVKKPMKLKEPGN